MSRVLPTCLARNLDDRRRSRIGAGARGAKLPSSRLADAYRDAGGSSRGGGGARDREAAAGAGGADGTRLGGRAGGAGGERGMAPPPRERAHGGERTPARGGGSGGGRTLLDGAGLTAAERDLAEWDGGGGGGGGGSGADPRVRAPGAIARGLATRVVDGETGGEAADDEVGHD